MPVFSRIGTGIGCAGSGKCLTYLVKSTVLIDYKKILFQTCKKGNTGSYQICIEFSRSKILALYIVTRR
jgi:hypothetical protein